MPDSAYVGHGKLWQKILCYGSKKGLFGKAPKMLLGTWIFQNGAIFLSIYCRHGEPSHICGFNTHMLKVFCFCQNWEFSNHIFFLMSLGITNPKFIILGQKLRSKTQTSIVWLKNWKSAKNLKWPYLAQ